MMHQRYYLHIQRLAYNYKGQKCKEHEQPNDGIGSCLLLEILFENFKSLRLLGRLSLKNYN